MDRSAQVTRFINCFQSMIDDYGQTFGDEWRREGLSPRDLAKLFIEQCPVKETVPELLQELENGTFDDMFAAVLGYM